MLNLLFPVISWFLFFLIILFILLPVSHWEKGTCEVNFWNLCWSENILYPHFNWQVYNCFIDFLHPFLLLRSQKLFWFFVLCAGLVFSFWMIMESLRIFVHQEQSFCLVWIYFYPLNWASTGSFHQETYILQFCKIIWITSLMLFSPSPFFLFLLFGILLFGCQNFWTSSVIVFSFLFSFFFFAFSNYLNFIFKFC